MTFRDRTHAGRLLALGLDPYRAERPIVLGLSRGGVPVAVEVARLLGADLDVLVVRKIGAPGSPDYAVGAVAEGGAVFVAREVLREVGAGEEWLAEASAREAAEVVRQAQVYRPERPLPELGGRTVIVVDDGVATGATARAAGRAARQRGAARVVLAAPVVAPSTEEALREEYDAVVAVERPAELFAVGQLYERFERLSDEDVVAYLYAATRRDAAAAVEELGAWPADPVEEALAVPLDDDPLGPGELEADLVVPGDPLGLVIVAHAAGPAHHGARQRFVARVVQEAGMATALLDLLTPAEAAEDAVSAQLRLDVRLLARRLLSATREISAHPRVRALPVCYLGAGTGAAAALSVAASSHEPIAAVVSRGGGLDRLEPRKLRGVRAPVLLIAGGRDEEGLRANRAALPHLRAGELAVVPGATRHFEEPGALGVVARLAAGWFARHAPTRPAPGAPPPA